MRVFASVLAFSAVIAAGAACPGRGRPTGACHSETDTRAGACARTEASANAAPGCAGTEASAAGPRSSGVEAPLPGRDEYAYVNVQAVAAASAEGKAAAEKIKGLQEQKSRELQEKNKTLQSAQQKLEQGGSVLSDQARAQLQTEIERQQRDLQRFTEDAQQDVQQLAEQVEGEFNRKLTPVIDRVAKQKGVHFVFNAAQSGLIWAEPGMDLTAEVIQAFDTPAAAAPAPAAPPK